MQTLYSRSQEGIRTHGPQVIGEGVSVGPGCACGLSCATAIDKL